MTESEILDEFELKADEVFATINCINIISDTEKFQKWLEKEHGIKEFNCIFEGYKFFLESAIRSFLKGIIYDSSLSIEEDFVFYRARFCGIPLSKIPNTCEKTILMKNLNKELRIIKKAENWADLKKALNQFNENVTKRFDKIFNDYAKFSSKLDIDKKGALDYVTMFYVMIYLNDTSRAIPHGFQVSLLETQWRKVKKQLKEGFKGYKYALQYVWLCLLGKKFFKKSVRNLHQAGKWNI